MKKAKGTTNNQASGASTTSDDAIEAALAAIEAADTAAQVTQEVLPPEVVVETVTEVVAADEVEIAVEVSDEEVLAELEASENDPQAIANAAPLPAAAVTTKPKRTSKKAAAPVTPAVPARDFHDIAQIKADELKTALDACAAKKVQEKAQNLIQAIQTGKRLSNFTSIAIKRLKAQGHTSGTDLTAVMQESGLSTGTARAQSQQMTSLFKIFGVAKPASDDPRKLVIHDTGLVEEMMKLAA